MVTHPRRVVDGNGDYIVERAAVSDHPVVIEQVSGSARGKLMQRVGRWGSCGCVFPYIPGGQRQEPRQHQ